MSQQKLDLQLRGLYTAPNNLSGVPQGALEVADNVVINSKSLIESRRGQTQYGSELSIGSEEVNKLFNYSSSLIVNYDDKLAYDSDNNGTWVEYSGTYSVPDSDYKMRSLEALRNFYFTTDNGIYKLDSLTSTPRTAGVSKALGGTGSTTGTGGFLVNNTAVAYRIVWGYVDANNNLILGAPSQRVVVANSSGVDVDVNLSFLIPDTITTEYFYQIYRSQAAATAADEPSDELQLCIQGNATQVEITARTFTVLDQTPYSLLRTTLYTSPSQQGIANANYQPPWALDMASFKSCAFYANIKQKQSLSVSLISVDSPSLGYVVDATVGTTNTSTTLTTIADTTLLRVGMRCIGAGIPVNTTIAEILTATTVRMSQAATATASVSVEFQDRVTLDEVDYWGGSSQSVSTNQFLVDISGTPEQNINETAINLVEIVNTSASNTSIYGYYISTIEDLPGQIFFEERSIGGSVFTATSTAGSSFSPALPDPNLITNISIASPTVITSAAHGLTSGDSIVIYDSNSTPSVDGTQIVTVINSNTFSVPVAVTVTGTSGSWVSSALVVKSDNEIRQNRVFISKPSQPEAVPLYRYFDVGSANFPIQRIVALRDGIFFFKPDGIYRISGETFESFTLSLVDNTVTLKAAESAVPFNNQVFCFTTQGICAVTDAGVKIMSVPIENALLELSSEQFTNFATASFGVAYESARQYMFFTVTDENDTFATQAFIYNSLTDSWTRWLMDRTCGIVNTSVNKLFMAKTGTGQILIERKSFTNSDYADEEYDVTIDSVDSSTQITLTDASLVVEGMTITQSGRETLITDVTGDIITVVESRGFLAGSATVHTPIDCQIQWSPIDLENPGILKQFSEISLFFRNAAFQEIQASFATNISIDSEIVPIANTNFPNGWGVFKWGEQPWGGSLGGATSLRTYVPREKQRGAWLTLGLRTNEAFTGFSLQGLSLMFNPMDSRFK